MNLVPLTKSVRFIASPNMLSYFRPCADLLGWSLHDFLKTLILSPEPPDNWAWSVLATLDSSLLGGISYVYMRFTEAEYSIIVSRACGHSLAEWCRWRLIKAFLELYESDMNSGVSSDED